MGGVSRFRLGDWWVDPAANTLVRGHEEIRLEPKLMDVLRCLAGHVGDVVSKRELVDEVWRTGFIADNSLTRAIADLRRALGDDARSPEYIQTIPKRGYRLIATVGDEPQSGQVRAMSREPLAVIVGDRVSLGNRVGSMNSDHLVVCGGREIPLPEPTVVFGRGDQSDIRFLVSEVSRFHARINLSDRRAVIEDLRSKNGTRVNDRVIDRPHDLSSGDAIGIGPTMMVYRRLSVEPTVTRERT